MRTLIFLLCASVADARTITLFDGKSLRGWDIRPTSDPNVKGDWKVENGALVCGGSVPSWISTTDTFSDFRLTLEFRGAAQVNSGVFLRSQKDGQPHITGYELQIWDYQPQGYLTGSLVNSLKAEPVKILANEWNKYDVTVTGDHFVVILNGKKVLDGRDAKHSSGVIGFQCQKEQRIEFRDIKIQRIKE